MKSQNQNVFIITRTGLLSAISIILFYLEIPIFGPYKLDFSTLPAILAGFSMGPMSGIAVILIKDLVHMMSSHSGFVGELADFIMSCAYVLPAAFLYRFRKTKTRALLSMLAGSMVMITAAAFVNKYILFPLYHMTDEAVVGMCSSLWSYIDTIDKFIFIITVPFNLLKSVTLSLVTFLLYKKISPLLHRK